MNLLNLWKLRSKSQSIILPVKTEPVIGWRSWRLENGKLQSAVTPHFWPFRKPMTVDDPNWHMDKDGPNGIHAYKLRKNMMQYPEKVVGSVFMWGRIQEHEWGYRSEFAYPRTLLMAEDSDPITIMELEDNYGIPVELSEEVREMETDMQWFTNAGYTVYPAQFYPTMASGALSTISGPLPAYIKYAYAANVTAQTQYLTNALANFGVSSAGTAGLLTDGKP